jgi:hypothetical protein
MVQSYELRVEHISKFENCTVVLHFKRLPCAGVPVPGDKDTGQGCSRRLKCTFLHLLCRSHPFNSVPSSQSSILQDEKRLYDALFRFGSNFASPNCTFLHHWHGMHLE